MCATFSKNPEQWIFGGVRVLHVLYTVTLPLTSIPKVFSASKLIAQFEKSIVSR